MNAFITYYVILGYCIVITLVRGVDLVCHTEPPKKTSTQVAGYLNLLLGTAGAAILACQFIVKAVP